MTTTTISIIIEEQTFIQRRKVHAEVQHYETPSEEENLAAAYSWAVGLNLQT